MQSKHDPKFWLILVLDRSAWYRRVKNERSRKFKLPTREAEKRGRY